jgi:hypothetical protein
MSRKDEVVSDNLDLSPYSEAQIADLLPGVFTELVETVKRVAEKRAAECMRMMKAAGITPPRAPLAKKTPAPPAEGGEQS